MAESDTFDNTVVFKSGSSSSKRFRDPSYKYKLLRKSSTSLDSEEFEFDPETETRILVLYTGGTIGMKVHEGGTYIFDLL